VRKYKKYGADQEKNNVKEVCANLRLVWVNLFANLPAAILHLSNTMPETYAQAVISVDIVSEFSPI